MRAHLPGVLFFPASVRPLPAGTTAQARLPFLVPSCRELGREGRVVVTVPAPFGARRQLEFLSGGTRQEVDLDLILGACKDSVAVP